MARVDIRRILASPTLRRELMVGVIIATQAREGITTTRAQAERAYDHCTKDQLHAGSGEQIMLPLT